MIFAVLVALFILANPVAAILDGPGDIQTSPSVAYQNVPFDYHVTVYNSGNENLHVTDVVVTIKWPDEGVFSGDQFTNPTVTQEIFTGDQVVDVGGSYDFKGNFNTGFWGGLPVIVNVTGRNESDASLTVKTFETYIDFETASSAPLGLDRALLFPFLLPLFFGAFWIGFHMRKEFWSVEIDNAMKNGNPGELGYAKWWQYYWERDGEMWKNYLIWVVIAIFLAAVIAFL